MDKWKRLALEAVPFLLLWMVFFVFGLWLRRQIPLDVPPGEIHGFDYNGHGELSYENICQYAKSLWRFPYQSQLLDVSLSPIRNVGRHRFDTR